MWQALGCRCDLELLIRANHVRQTAARGFGSLLTERT